MGNILQELAERHNVTVRNLQAWGTVDGYWFEIQLPPRGSTVLNIRTAVKLADEDAEKTVAQGLEAMQAANRALTSARKNGRIVVSMKKPTGSSAAEAVDAVILRLAAIFHKAGAEPACYSCGSDQPGSFSMVNGVAMKLCPTCATRVESEITKKTEEYSAMQGNYLRGFLGALLGALLGSLVWVLIGYAGYLAAIGGFAIAFCAIKGYQIMKGKTTLPAIIGIAVISIVVMVAAQFVSYDLSVLKDNPDLTFGFIMKRIFELLFVNSDLTSDFIKQTVLGLVFLILGSWRLIVPLLRQAKSPNGKFERL